MIKRQADQIIVLRHHLSLYPAVLATDLILPIPLPWFVCQRPAFLIDGHLGRLNNVQFSGIFRLSQSPFLGQYVGPEYPIKYSE